MSARPAVFFDRDGTLIHDVGYLSRLEDLPVGALDGLPADVSLWPGFADISDQVERKIAGITLYRSQLKNLFGGRKPMADSVRSYGLKVGARE